LVSSSIVCVVPMKFSGKFICLFYMDGEMWDRRMYSKKGPRMGSLCMCMYSCLHQLLSHKLLQDLKVNEVLWALNITMMHWICFNIFFLSCFCLCTCKVISARFCSCCSQHSKYDLFVTISTYQKRVETKISSSTTYKRKRANFFFRVSTKINVHKSL
jgi:hypothetical protein